MSPAARSTGHLALFRQAQPDGAARRVLRLPNARALGGLSGASTPCRRLRRAWVGGRRPRAWLRRGPTRASPPADKREQGRAAGAPKERPESGLRRAEGLNDAAVVAGGRFGPSRWAPGPDVAIEAGRRGGSSPAAATAPSATPQMEVLAPHAGEHRPGISSGPSATTSPIIPVAARLLRRLRSRPAPLLQPHGWRAGALRGKLRRCPQPQRPAPAQNGGPKNIGEVAEAAGLPAKTMPLNRRISALITPNRSAKGYRQVTFRGTP